MDTYTSVAVAAATYLLWPSLGVLAAIGWRATYDHFVTRPQVEKRLAEDRQVARLDAILDVDYNDPLEAAWRAPSARVR